MPLKDTVSGILQTVCVADTVCYRYIFQLQYFTDFQFLQHLWRVLSTPTFSRNLRMTNHVPECLKVLLSKNQQRTRVDRRRKKILKIAGRNLNERSCFAGKVDCRLVKNCTSIQSCLP